MNEIIIKTDGGSRGNPGPAAIGVSLEIADWSESYGQYIGVETNNVAEYSAILDIATKLSEEEYRANIPVKFEKISFKLDSELVVKQLNGLYRVKDANLAILHKKVKEQIDRIRSQGIIIQISHIPRTQNKIADQEVNIALDNQLKTK